jgi:carbon storage regulator
VIAQSGEFASLWLAVSPAGIRRMDATELGNLVFSRRAGQRFVVDGNVEITIVRVNGEKVRLAVKAPKDVRILRSELLDEVPEATAEPIAG